MRIRDWSSDVCSSDLFFFGRRWQQGDKSQYKFVGQALAAQGFLAVIPNYRLYPQVRFPDFVKDGANAVKWARDNADRYGGSSDRLFVMGHSSGAHIAAMLALDEEFLKGVGGSRSRSEEHTSEPQSLM